MPLNILNELVLIPGRMPFAQASSTTDTGVSMGVRNTERQLRIGSPWFVRNLHPESFGKNWPNLCGLLRSSSIPVFCGTVDLEAVPAALVPMRFSRRAVNLPLRPEEVQTADALELDSCIAGSENYAWPAEIGSLAHLKRFVQTVRLAAGNSTPIGLSLAIGARIEDMDACLDAEVDFVSLVDHQFSSSQGDALLVESLVSLRSKCLQAKRDDLPILLTTNVSQVADLPKLLALGASAVSIDQLITTAFHAKQSNETGAPIGGMLSGIGAPPKSKQDLTAVQQIVDDLKHNLEHCMQATMATHLRDLNPNSLRSLTPRASSITKIPMLGSKE